jgi:DNA primase
MEGQFDVITAHQFGVGNSVASSGTALTDDQVRLMKRFTDELLLVFDADRAGQQAMRKAAVLAAQLGMRTRAATLPDGMDPDEFLRAAGAQAGERWQGVVESAPSSFEAGVAQDIAGFNPSNANQMEIVAGRLREWIGQFPEGLRDGYVEVAERRTGISRHLLLRGPEPKRELRPAANGLNRQLAGKKTTVSRYLLQLLAVNPAAFERIRTKLTPEDLDDEDRGIYVRMMETYDRAGASGLENELGNYPAEVQDLIRRAWAAPPPSVDGQVAEELVARLRLDRMKGRHSGIIRELSDAERGRESERVARLEAEARELARAINDMERSS